MMVLGIVVCLLLAIRILRGSPEATFPPQEAFSLFPWCVVGGMVGARLFHVVDSWGYYANYPLQMFRLWEGGLSWYGGLTGTVVAMLVYTRVRRLPLGQLLDAVAPGLLGLAVGRVGCTINGDSWGIPTALPWGITYTHPGSYAPLGVPGHPAPVYEIIWILMVVAAVWKLRRRLKPEGSLFLATVALYSLGRFGISWVRAEPAVLGPLHQAHIISLALLVGCTALLAWRRRGKPSGGV